MKTGEINKTYKQFQVSSAQIMASDIKKNHWLA